MFSSKTAILIFIFFAPFLHTLSGQKQNNQWRFGQNGAIDFNTTPPSSPTGSAIQTPEGSASIADPLTAQLLFYTDGITVWNRNNQPMPNGTGLLGGTSTLLSSTTAAVIVPKPATSGIYYIVTIDEQSSSNGVRYNVVDISLDGGLGNVVPGQKNIPLYSTTSEKLHVVPTADACGYWLLTHDNPGNTFAAFKITQNGIETLPVESSAGGTQGNGAGHLKVNRQFNKLALGNFFDSTIELFDFNNTTGVVSNPLIWNFSFPNSLLYGVEFSPDGSKLYVSNIEKIIQYDISQATPALIEASAFVVSQGLGASYQPAALQLGPDNKIYIAAGTIDAIEFPNNPGASCGFQQNAIVLQNANTGYGLPQSVLLTACNTGITGIKINGDTCRTDNIAFQAVGTSSSPYFFWNFGDPASGSSDTITITGASPSPFPTHNFTNPGIYTVCVSFQEPGAAVSTVCRTISIGLCCNGILVSNDTCLNNNISFSIATGETINSILWDFGDPASGVNNTAATTAPSHIYGETGVYSVRAIVQFECGTDTFLQTITIVDCDCKLYIPNVFSPNNDGINDEFNPIVTCTPEEYTFSVFNRWGGLVYQTKEPSGKWDGTLDGRDCPMDVYAYLVTYKFAGQASQTMARDVTLLR